MFGDVKPLCQSDHLSIDDSDVQRGNDAAVGERDRRESNPHAADYEAWLTVLDGDDRGVIGRR